MKRLVSKAGSGEIESGCELDEGCLVEEEE